MSGNPSDGEYEELFPSQAAKRLGIAVPEVKRRLKNGELNGRRDEKGRWRIALSARPKPKPSLSDSTSGSSGGGTSLEGYVPWGPPGEPGGSGGWGGV